MNHSGRFLTQEQMAEAKREEARLNSLQKRRGTNFPLSAIIAWGCGCCIGPVINENKGPILTSEQADALLKARKRKTQHNE